MASPIWKACCVHLVRCHLANSRSLSLRRRMSLANRNHPWCGSSPKQIHQYQLFNRNVTPVRSSSNESGKEVLGKHQRSKNIEINSLLTESNESSKELQAENLEFEGFSKDEIVQLTSEPIPRVPVDPSLTSVFLFPGQGSQFVGMCNGFLNYPNVQEMFEVASEILQYNLKGLCINGPKEDLDQTIFCQHAVFITSLAAVEKLKEEDPKAIENCVAAAGFSVGEFAALVFAGSLSFEDAVCLIQVRAEAMQRASEMAKTGMLSVIGRDRARYKYICKEATTYSQNHGVENAVCSVANYLYPDARVLAGNVEALDFIQENAKSFSLKSTRRLPVSGAFHTSFMEPAGQRFGAALEEVEFQTPLVKVHSNVDGKVYRHPGHIKKLLGKHLTVPVKWEQTMHEIYERSQGVAFPWTYEVGPGRQLGTILKRINKKAYEKYGKVD